MPHIFTAFWLESGTKQQNNTVKSLDEMGTGNTVAESCCLCETGAHGSDRDMCYSPEGPVSPGKRTIQNIQRTAFKNYLLVQAHV